MNPSLAVRAREGRLLADLAILGIAAVWGATFFMVKEATSAFPVMAFLALRFTLASAALVPFMLRQGRWPTRQEWRWGVIAGLLFCGGYVFQTFSLRLVDSGRTGFITGLYVIMVPLLALILLRHPLKLRALLGAGLAVVGLGLLSNAPGGNLPGDVLAILCALCFAAQIVAVEKFPPDADWRIMSIVQSVVVAVICAALVPLQAAVHACDTAVCLSLGTFAEPLPTALPLKVLAVAAFTGLIATALGLVIQVWAQRRLSPSDTALIFVMESPFSALFGFLFLGEMLSAGGLLGCGLMLTGMLTTALAG